MVRDSPFYAWCDHGPSEPISECYSTREAAEAGGHWGAVMSSTTVNAQAAWATLSRAAGRIGGYKSVAFEDVAINATICHLGGWPKRCGLPRRVFDGRLRREFLAAYVMFSAKGVSERDGRPLWGIHDAENHRHGFHDFVMAPIEIRVEAPDDFIRN